MEIDRELLSRLSHIQNPILHFYEWEAPCATYGYFLNPHDYIQASAVEKLQLQLAKRPTGGGVIFHLCDFAFSMLLPASHSDFSLNTLENYAFVNNIVLEAVQGFSGGKLKTQLLETEATQKDFSAYFCMAKPTQYDVMIEGKKVGGGAQRRTRHGYLHQGAISLMLPPEPFLAEVLLPETGVLENMRRNTFALLGHAATAQEQLEAKKELRKQLWNVLSQV